MAAQGQGSRDLNLQLADTAILSSVTTVPNPKSGAGSQGAVENAWSRHTDLFAVDIPLVLQGPVKSLLLSGSCPRGAHSRGEGADSGGSLPWPCLVVVLFPQSSR